MSGTNDVFDIIHTTRAMRRLKPDPVPDELIVKILEAGVCAPNAGNQQSWRFLVIKDQTIKDRVQSVYQRAYDDVVKAAYRESEPPAGVTPKKSATQSSAVEYLTQHFHEAPVWIVACVVSDLSGEHKVAPDALKVRLACASIYPAVQNMLLAARALGLGATMTVRHLVYEDDANDALGLPDGVSSFAILPIGYPLGNFGPVRRDPLSDVVFEDRFGQAWPALAG